MTRCATGWDRVDTGFGVMLRCKAWLKHEAIRRSRAEGRTLMEVAELHDARYSTVRAILRETGGDPIRRQHRASKRRLVWRRAAELRARRGQGIKFDILVHEFAASNHTIRAVLRATGGDPYPMRPARLGCS